MLRKASWLFFFAFVILVIFLPGYSKLQEMRQRNKDLESRIITVQQENIDLRQEKGKLEKDKVYLEKIAREKMGLARDGEVIYRIAPGK